jgi:hypothetical protein
MLRLALFIFMAFSVVAGSLPAVTAEIDRVLRLAANG